jgi:ribosome-associated heat shock protein Hsp15
LVSDEKIKVNGDFIKSSKAVKIGDVISMKEIPIWRSFKVLDIPKSRVGAPLVKDLIVETTTEEDMALLEEVRETNRQNLQFGIKGRPTKKNRRNLDEFKFD